MPHQVLNHRWPPLFKKSKSGKISTWQIWVLESTIHTRSGFVGMKMQETTDKIAAGKNIGKKNETSPHDQAVLEAQSRLDKQIDRGYVWDANDAASGKVDSKIQGAYYPMLAHSFDKHGSKVAFPCFVQPKLDGLRATCINGEFFSRSRKPFPAMNHLTEEIKRLGLDDLMLDGELYNHDYKDNFEEIVSAVKRGKDDNPNTKLIQYHIYDVNMEGSYTDRKVFIDHLRSRCTESDCIVLVETRLAETEEDATDSYDDFMEAGYEGAMLRNFEGEYECNRRSYDLQKLKRFQDAEFPIVAISEGRGRLAGHVAAYVCEINDEKGKRLFKAKMEGDTSKLKTAFEDPKVWKGQWLKVQFQGYTRKNSVPRFPVGLRFRDAE